MRPSVLIGPILIILALLIPRALSTYHTTILLQLYMMIALAQSWNLISGLTGYTSFGHAVFFGVGAYTGALMLLVGFPWWFAAFASAGSATLLAIPIGSLTLRLRGPYFAIAMLGLNEVGRIVATLWVDVTQGGDGIALTPKLLPSLTTNYYTMLFLALLSTWVIVYVLGGRIGLELRAIREDEGAAEMVGVNTTQNKVSAFVASAVIPGAVGAIYAFYTSFIDPSSVFQPALNVQMIVMVLLGGRGTVWGPVIGATIVMAIQEITWAEFPALHLALLGVLLIVIVLYLPNGILSLMQRRKRVRPDQLPEQTD